MIRARLYDSGGYTNSNNGVAHNVMTKKLSSAFLFQPPDIYFYNVLSKIISNYRKHEMTVIFR
jgi:hypothetical protein